VQSISLLSCSCIDQTRNRAGKIPRFPAISHQSISRTNSGGGTAQPENIQIRTLAMSTADEPTEAVNQVGEETTEAMEQVGEEATEAMELGGEESSGPMELCGEKPTDEMQQIRDEPEPEEADAEEDSAAASLRPALPLGRVKRIIRVDADIKKVTSEATMLITAATELFLGSLASGAHAAAAARGRRAVRAAHVRAAARAHRPTADFLLDCLPADEEAPRARSTAGSGSSGGGGGAAKPPPRVTRRIDAFFQKVT
jgi:DNA-directed RNA polymerase I subunit RPA43